MMRFLYGEFIKGRGAGVLYVYGCTAMEDCPLAIVVAEAHSRANTAGGYVIGVRRSLQLQLEDSHD